MTQGLTILVATGDAERLHAALTFAASSAAMGGATRLHLHEGAVALLCEPMIAAGDSRRKANGLPALDQIWDDALGLGVVVTVCQSGLALAGLTLDELDPGIEAQGPVGLLSALGDDRIITF